MKARFALSYLQYYFKAGNRHSVHSPFIYQLVNEILPNKPVDDKITAIESIRKNLYKSDVVIPVDDFGAGSKGRIYKERKLGEVARSSSKPEKYCRLLYNLSLFYRPEYVIELGTAAGISAMYLAAGNPESRIFTIEGSKGIATVASANFKTAGFDNIRLVNEAFETGLPRILNQIPQADLVFIDGNHRKIPTLNYFNLALQKSHKYTIFVIDDINWSDEMREVWEEIKNHDKVTATVNLFMMGLVFLNPELSRQEFVIRY